ncbi:BMP family ABC transporter substrate-binding protein [Microbacterium sp. X-17]|uniref:BMP family lipoprotein n=1 Tax=Microbacterium sp. X-17 TaxID=3144404 RepID=UPI0031F518CB
MTTTGSTRRRRLGAAVGGLAVAALLISGCAGAEANDAAPSQSSSAPSILPCIVSQPDGQDPIVQLAYDGVRQAADELGVRYDESPAATTSAVPDAIDHLLGEGCTVVVTSGDRAYASTIASAATHPAITYIWVDDTGAQNASNRPELATTPNVRPVLFDLTQPAYLAGYLAAGMTKSGVVGTFAEADQPISTAVMDAFAQGVERYDQVNAEKLPKPVRVVGWDRATKQADFLETSDNDRAATHAVQTLLQDGADIIFPVRLPARGSGKFYQQIASLMTNTPTDVSLIGIGSDSFESAPDVSGSFLTSLVTAADVGVYGLVLAAAKGPMPQTTYVGTLANGGVDLAPYHDWSDRVPENLTSSISLLETAVVGGGVVIDASAPH